MKRSFAVVLAAAVALLGTACGGRKEEVPAVDLEALYTAIAEDLGWDEDYMAEIEGDMLESYYPGLGEVGLKQLTAHTPAMSSEVNELVFLECETGEDADTAEEILQKRIDGQAGGGAWYAESMEAWSGAAVVRRGLYVAMIASAPEQDALERRFLEALGEPQAPAP